MTDHETENAVATRTDDLPAEGESFEDAMRRAATIVKSGLVPKSLNTPEKVYVAIQTGTEAGLSPMAAVRSVYVIGGSPAWKGEAALGLIRRSGLAQALEVGCEKIDGDPKDPEAVRGFMRWVDLDGSPREVLYTKADAQLAGLWGKDGPWKQHPKDMLMWRAVGRASKRYFSGVLMGLELAEVAGDFRRNERPAPVVGEAAPAAQDGLLAQATATEEPEAPVLDVPALESPAYLDEPPEDWEPTTS